MFNGKIHYQWSFSIAMLNYQRVMETMVMMDIYNYILMINGDDIPIIYIVGISLF